MKSLWREIIMAVLMGMVLPGIVLNWAVVEPEPEEIPSIADPQATIASIQASDGKMKLRKDDGSVVEMEVDTYLAGVILGEMPSTFELEAKKAQAVVARTFTAKALSTGGKHGDGSVCRNSACCQAYISVAEYLERGGSLEAVDAARQAVSETGDYVVTYEGALIEATYFSCSGGRTEDAVAVWGTDFPYLRTVESPGEEHAVHYSDTCRFTREEISDRLGIALTGPSDAWIGEVTYTSGGGVESMVIGGTHFSGTQLRSLLNLRSTAFSVECETDGITITTRGFGHRVGMSQYGADAMAMDGSTWQEIIGYYYTGTSLELTNVFR